MDNPLYKRYIPPRMETENQGVKRKREQEQSNGAVVTNGQIVHAVRKEKKSKKREKEKEKKRDPKRITGLEEGQSINEVDRHTSNEINNTSTIESDNHPHRMVPSQEVSTSRSKRKDKPKRESPLQNEDAVDSSSSRHSKMLSKFKRAIEHQPTEEGIEADVEPEEPDVNDLTPFPLPEQPDYAGGPDTLEHLPSWISKPIRAKTDRRISFKELHVAPRMISELGKNGFHTALPLQCELLPRLLPVPTQYPGDLCVSAHTGSGKTLSYVLPILQDLRDDVMTHLRVLIIVPTRELVEQVRRTLDIFSTSSKLKIGTAVGSKPLDEEQSTLIRRWDRYDPAAYKMLMKRRAMNMGLQPYDSDDDSDDPDVNMSAREFLDLSPNFVPHFLPNVDILIATPGRLVEHIKETRGFNLDDLKWLVIDEADRLLDASFQEWVETLMEAIKNVSLQQQPILPIPLNLDIFPWPHKIRKVILSATMTRDLEKLSPLQLFNAKMVVLESTEPVNVAGGDGSTKLPATLTQFGTPVGDGSDKPLYLLNLLIEIISPSLLQDRTSSEQQMNPPSTSTAPSNVLIFTASTEAAHRLYRLLVLLKPEYESLMSTITKSNASKTTRKLLSSFHNSKIRILIATERASRGLDLPNLENVVNYDIPHNIISYTHRVGRTARAGQTGTAWTLIEDRQAAWFWKALAKTEYISGTNGGIIRKRLDISALDPTITDRYTEALRQLEQDVKSQKH